MSGIELDGVASWRTSFDRVARLLYGHALNWLVLHWLGLAVVLNALFVTVAVLNPVLAAQGYTAVSVPVGSFYHLFCTQEHVYSLRGQPLALCQRNLAIFSSTFLGMVAFAAVRGRVVALTLWGYVVLALPMAVDGITQLVGWRTSSVELRTFTGVLFGLASIWYLFPAIDGALFRFLESGQDRWTDTHGADSLGTSAVGMRA